MAKIAIEIEVPSEPAARILARTLAEAEVPTEFTRPDAPRSYREGGASAATAVNRIIAAVEDWATAECERFAANPAEAWEIMGGDKMEIMETESGTFKPLASTDDADCAFCASREERAPADYIVIEDKRPFLEEGESAAGAKVCDDCASDLN